MTPFQRNIAFLLGSAAMLACCSAVCGQSPGTNVYQQVGFDQRLGQSVPLDLHFVDSTGEDVVLGDYFRGRPVILNLVYYECPMLCTLQLNGLVRGLKMLDLTPGQDFEVVTVSFDPGETPVLAAAKRKIYLQQYARPAGNPGWHFLTGTPASIDALSESVGARYAYDSAKDQYAHASGLVFVTPDGNISRYLFGVEFPPRDLKLALVESSAGKVGSPVDHLLLLCYSYDPATGRYGLVVMNLVRLGGLATIVALAAFIGRSLYREARQKTVTARD